MKIIKFINMLIFILIIINNFKLICDDCGNTTNCPNKKYPYYFCNKDESGFAEKYCIENPWDPNLKPSLVPFRAKLPICYNPDISTIPGVLNISSGRGGEIKIFDPNIAISEFAEAAYIWNCLCGKEDEECQCSIKVSFSANPKDFYDPEHELAEVHTLWYWPGWCDVICSHPEYKTEIIFNKTKQFLNTDVHGRIHKFFINEKIIMDYAGNIFDDLAPTYYVYDLLQTAVHELGHVLMYLPNHWNESNGGCPGVSYDGIMNMSQPDNTAFEGLSIDDICMFKKLYCPELTPVAEEHEIADDIKNYPNPLDDIAYIELSIPDGGDIVSIKIYSMFNELVSVIDKNYMSSGTHKFKFDASSLPPGVYFCEINIGRSKFVKKMVAYR